MTVASKSKHKLEDRIELKNAIASQPQIEFPTGKYNIIVADPPWKYELRESDKTHRGITPYSNMGDEEILALPMGAIADNPSYLFLWTTKDHLSLAFKCLEKWGFEYKNTYPWVKFKDGKIQMGMGHWGRNCSEFLLIAVRGKAPAFSTLGITNQPTAFLSPRIGHSEKPEDAQEFIWRVSVALEGHLQKNSDPLLDMIPGEKLKTKVKRIELFARESREGWDVWGNEVSSGECYEEI